MPVHKIDPQNPATFITGTVVDVQIAPSQNPRYKPQYKIEVNVGGSVLDLYGSQAGVDRQVARLGLPGPDALIGGAYTFSKTPMQDDPSKGLINITRATPTAARRPAASTRAAHSAGPLVPGLDALDDFDLVEEDAAQTADLQRALSAPKPAQGANKAATAQAHYAAHFAWYVQTILPQLNELQIPVDAGNINAAVATLMIEEAKR